MIGTALSRYRITAKLGEGGMGSVWLAEDTLLGRHVALKLLAHHLAVSESARQRFVREARAASRLEHPGIAAVHDAGEADGHVFIAYQFIEGETLEKRLAAGPVPMPELLRLARGVAEALAHAHERDVLHRDLTAGNVMLRPDGSPVIVDFGLARTRGDVTLTSTGTTLGTAPYLAPEQWRGERGDARTDLWSLGVVLYFAATGQQPFGAEPPEAVMFRALNDDPVKPTKLRSELPGDFERLLLRLLEKDPRDRPASAAEVAASFKAVANANAAGEAIALTGETTVARLRRWWHRQRRRRLGSAQVAALMATLLVVAAGTTFLVRRELNRRELVLAVMPFRNTSADREDTGYIGEALGSELTARLGRMGGFRVLPWETTTRFADSKRSFSELAHDLGADLLLVGHYEGNDERIAVGLELVEGHGGLERWSDRLVSTTRDLALMQSDLAGRVANQLAPAGGKARKAAVLPHVAQNPEAYEAYLRGVYAFHATSAANRALAEPMFRHALDLDSTLSEAWVGLGAVIIKRYYEGGRGGLADMQQGQRCFERALALDPVSSTAIRGMVRVLGESDNTAEQALAFADSAGPRVADEIERQLIRGWACYGVLTDEAVDAFGRILTLDPHNQAARWMDSFCLWWAGRLPEAVDCGKSYIREFGEDPDVYAYCGAALAAMGRYDEAKVFLHRAVSMFSGSSGSFAVLYYASILRSSGDLAAANKLLDEKLPEFEVALAAAPDNLRLRTDLANLYAARADMPRFEAQISIVSRDIASGAPGSGGEYVYTPFVLAQVGQLERAKQLLTSFPVFGGFNFLAPAEVGTEKIFRGARSAEFASSPELIRLRASVQASRAALRKRYPWLAGASRGVLTDVRRTQIGKRAS